MDARERLKKVISINDVIVDGKKLIVKLKHLLRMVESTSVKTTVLRIYRLCSFLVHFHNAYDYRQFISRDMEVHDLYKFINIYGYGYCKQHTMFMGFLLDQFDIKNRIIYLGEPGQQKMDHFAIEVFYDKQWHFFDPNLQIIFLLDETIVSANDIANRNFNIISGEIHPTKFLNCDPNFFLRNEVDFKNEYLAMFNKINEFNLCKQDFAYKHEITSEKGIVKWYQYNEKDYYFTRLKSVVFIDNGYGISNYQLIPSNDAIQFLNVKFEIDHGDKELEINDFPLLILEITVFTSSNSNQFDLFVNGKKYSSFSNEKKSCLFSTLNSQNIYNEPIYSVKIVCNNIIEHYEIISQKSKFSQLIETMV